MERYIGVDVHAASCTIAVISERGKRLRDRPTETNGQALVETIRAIPGRKHVILEEGTQSAWLYEIVSPHVEELVVAGVTRSRGQKNDKSDAYALAEKLRVGSVEKRVFKAPRQFSMLRELARTQAMMAGDVVRVQARLKSLYRSRGVPTPGASVYGQRDRGQWMKQLPGAIRTVAMSLYDQYDFVVELKEKAEAELLQELGKHSIARMLQTAPGLGPIRVARLLSVVITPHRFRTKRQFWSYCGLGIVMRSSSDWVRAVDGRWMRAQVQHARGLSRQYNRSLKDVFKGAATTVITQTNKDPIYAVYERLIESGTKPNLAKVSLARAIAATVLRMWKDGEEYKPEYCSKRVHSNRDA
jgi:transposase